MTRSIMIQGTGSNVGKSLVVAGLARAFAKRGMTVAPFKPQNMSNNAAATVDDGEIGRAQALQALAAGVQPTIDMNPVLLKPESDTGAQVVVQGRRMATVRAGEYAKLKHSLLPKVMESFTRLAGSVDLILVEGAGSPAEINLRSGDIANMGFAEAAGIPVVLVADIDRGGVIAQLVGTQAVLPPNDSGRISAFLINKFRGDVTLFDEAIPEIERRTGWKGLGVLPWFSDAWKLPAEDVMDIRSTSGGPFKVAVPRLNRIANFDDLDPLAAEPDVRVEIVEPGRALPGDANLVLIPGSKSTVGDLADFRRQGWDIDLLAHVRRGGHVLGMCGGYQMLGREIIDTKGSDGSAGRFHGLGLLDVVTEMSSEKRTTRTEAIYSATGAYVSGYEIHLGRTEGPDRERAWLRIGERTEGAASLDGRIRGCYLHGIFSSDDFRTSYLAELGGLGSGFCHEAMTERTLDDLASHLETHMDVESLLSRAWEIPGISAVRPNAIAPKVTAFMGASSR